MKHEELFFEELTGMGNIFSFNTGSSTTTTIQVKGKVIDFGTGQPIDIVNIYVKGNSTNGTASAADGTFTLNALPGDTIVFSHQTYENVEWPATQASGTVRMIELPVGLEEVVITNKKTNWIKYAGLGLLTLAFIVALTRKGKKD